MKNKILKLVAMATISFAATVPAAASAQEVVVPCGVNTGSGGFELAMLHSLDAEDDVVSAVNGLPPYSWSEDFQKSPQHDERLLKVVQRAVGRTGATGPELEAFLAIR